MPLGSVRRVQRPHSRLGKGEAKVEGTGRATCQDYGVEGYPALKWFPNDGSGAVDMPPMLVKRLNFLLKLDQRIQRRSSGQRTSGARRTVRRLARSGEKVEAIYASEAIRTQQTAETVCAAINDPPPVTVMPTVDLGSPETARGICEIAMGAWTGKDKKECETAEVALAREHDCWEWQPHGLSEDEGLPGESYRDVEERVLRFLDGE